MATAFEIVPGLPVGGGAPLVVIAGPCVIESQSLMAATAERLKKLSEKLSTPLVFKSSYLKDNRSDELSYQGPGLDDGLEMLAWIRKEFELPVLSDVHSPDRFRVNGPLPNIDAWYEAFKVQPGDKLYIKPEDRVRIW